MIYSVHPSEKMRNPVTLGANIKYVLIKLYDEVEDEASPSRTTINYTTKGSPDCLAKSFLSILLVFYPSTRKFPDGFYL